MTYQELIDLITDEAIDLEESFTQEHIDLLLQRAQLRIERDLDLNAQRSEVTVTAASGAPLVSLPSETVLVRSVRLKDGDFLDNKDVTYLRDYWPDPSETGTPKFYAWKDDEDLLVAPTPDSDTDLELEITERIPVLSEQQDTNWISENMPDVMQLAVMIEAAHWSKDNEQMSAYMERYNQTLQSVSIEENVRKRRDEYRYGAPRGGN